MPRKNKKVIPKKKKITKKSNTGFWNNNYSSKNLIIFALVFGSISAYGLWRAFAQTTPVLVFNGNFNTGDFSQWSFKPQQGADADCCVIKKHQDRNSVARMTVEPGDQYATTTGERAEVYAAGTKYTANEGDVERVHWENYFPSYYLQNKLTGGWNIFTQWHHSGSTCSIPVQFKIDAAVVPYHMQLTVSHIADMATCQYLPPDRFDLGPVPYNSWTSFDFYVTWSSDPNIGSVRVLINGKEVVPATHVATMYAGNTNYLKQGFYRGPTSFTNRIFLDGTKVYRYQ